LAIHLPDLAAMAEHHSGQVAPTYTEAPAPMGVSDLGLINESGTLVPYEFNTSSVRGTIAFTNAESAYVDGDGPDMFGVQLNSVDTGVTVFGNASNEFWTQNFVSYTSSSGELVFGDNIWNFSNYNALISSNVFYAHGPNGTLYAPIFYYAIGPTFTIHYPFTVTFYNNATVLDDRPAVFFNYTVTNATMSVSGSYDYVIFNSTATTPARAAPSGEFQVNGYSYDPVGLPNDIELDVVGNDDGDTTSFYAMDATETIDSWNASAAAFQPVPSAVDAGSETGETSDGIAVYFEAGSSVAHLGLGPSFLTGLWNVSSSSGVRTYVLALTPANAFLFASPGGAFDPAAAQWVPTFGAASNTISLPGTAPIWIELELSDYTPRGLAAPIGANSTSGAALTLTRNTAEGVYTPLIADGNSQLRAISSGGVGTSASPYLLENNEYGPIQAEFDAWNDFQFPVFPGLLLIGTTAAVSVTPPPFAIVYPVWQLETGFSLGLPGTNNLQIQFWNVSDVRLIGGTITGWLSFELSGFPEGSVLFWNSTGDLVASNTFLVESNALTLYGGINNTIWGNTFLPVAPGGSVPSEVLDYGPDYAQGVNESESDDRIYNNYFAVPYPAITPTLDPLSCQINCTAVVYSDVWNIGEQPASGFSTALGTNLTGSILGTSYQGGNYWSNYGAEGNPYGVLPYNDSSWITRGGDSVPLVPFALTEVTFLASGLPTGVAWGILTDGVLYNTTAADLSTWGPNGTYAYLVFVPVGYTVSTPGLYAINGTPLTITINFLELGSVAGTVTPAQALLLIDGAEIPLGPSGAFGVSMVPGRYSVVASASGYDEYQTNVTVTAGATTSLPIALTSVSSSPPPSTPSGASISGTAWGIIGALAALAVILAITTILVARRGGRPPSGPLPPYPVPPPAPPAT
jgi:thermopsin